jgi:hypothetical protein
MADVMNGINLFDRWSGGENIRYPLDPVFWIFEEFVSKNGGGSD